MPVVGFVRGRKHDSVDRRRTANQARAHIEILLENDLATAQAQVEWSPGVLEWAGDGVVLHAQADTLEWFARELARLPFDFKVMRPAALRAAVAPNAQRLRRLPGRRS